MAQIRFHPPVNQSINIPTVVASTANNSHPMCVSGFEYSAMQRHPFDLLFESRVPDPSPELLPTKIATAIP